ncbi:MAG: methyltransferase domain-containing protein [Candidatus Omnitrophica bacterium]|nr:methyltransferase domain-containing protein [Candidatus Omnitrophota bacterium]
MHQIDEVRKVSPHTVLEVGVGSSFVSRYLQNYYNLTTLDISNDVGPDCVGSVTHFPFKDNTFDVVLCCEVLEHLPFSDFEAALSELKRIAKRRVIMSLPDKRPFFPVQFPIIGRIKIPYFFFHQPEHIFDGQHHWEINARGTELKKILETIENMNFAVIDTYQVFENYKHRFFMLEK